MRATPPAAAAPAKKRGGILKKGAREALTPPELGAGTLGHTVVAYLASWGRAVFFADNLLVNAAFVAVGLWIRDLLVLALSGSGRPLLVELALYSPLQALTSALFALLVLLAFREWFAIRLDA